MQYDNPASLDAWRGPRRIVTGLGEDGRSCVTSDGYVGEAELGNFNLWICGPRGADPAGELPPTAIPFMPKVGGSLVRMFRLPPAGEAADPAALEAIGAQLEAAIGVPGCRPDLRRHPLMHVTPTTDVVMLLSGSVSLQLEQGAPVALRAGDVVVQRQTNHAWINTGREDALLLAVMVSRL